MHRNDTKNFQVEERGGELRAVFALANPKTMVVGDETVLVREATFNQRTLGKNIIDAINNGTDPTELWDALIALDKANNDRIRQAWPITHFIVSTLLGFSLTEGTVLVNDKAVAANKAARQQPAQFPSPAP